MKATNSLIFLTYRCTSRCKTCNIWKWNKSSDQELFWEEWEKILIKMRNYGIKTVEIFGGDALLRKDVIFRIIEFCSKNNIKTYFPTNSILLDKETANALVQSGLHTIYFSLDDIGHNNDKIRGVNDTFSKVNDALNNLINARGASKNPRVNICTTISKMNYNHFQDIVRFISNYPIDTIYPRVLGEFSQKNIGCSTINGIIPEPFFISSDNSSHRLSKMEFIQFRTAMNILKKENRNTLPYINFREFYDTDENIILGRENEIKNCLLPSRLLILNPNGDVIPCLFFKNYVLGNLVKDDLEKILDNTKHRNFIYLQKTKKIKICSECISRTSYHSFFDKISYYKKRLLEKANNHL